MNIYDLKCQTIFFNGKNYERKYLNECIDNLSKHISKNIKSDSPFIMLTSYNHIKTFIAFFAILKAQKIVVILDPLCKNLEITEIIQKVNPSAIIIPDISTDKFDFNTEIIFRENKFATSENLKDIKLLVFTNAEDGFLKAAMLTEKNLLFQAETLIKTNKINNNSIICSLLPFSHMFGLMHGIIIPAHSNAKSLIIETNLLNLKTILETVHKYKVTHLYSIPSTYYLISKIPHASNYLETTNNIYSGGVSLSQKIYEDFYIKIGKKIREGYGLTEAAPGVTLNYDDIDPIPGSIGKPLPNIQVKIVNNNSICCNIDEIGEICVKGPNIFKGYYNDEKNSKKILKDGWLYTGDLGKIDKKGNIYFCGLKKKMINVGGINVYPEYVKRLMKKNSNVEDVIIYHEESPIFYNIPCARIYLKNNSESKIEEFKEWCRKNINNSILPVKMEFNKRTNLITVNKLKIYEHN